MRYLSVCSGIEAATVAWHPLGWQPVAFSEVDAFPSAVLAHHYPHVPNLGDMTKFEDWPDADVDVLVGGTPCQSFSVAGLRKGLGDPRGNLMLTFGAIAHRYRPEWLVWENVPGVLSSNGGRDFGTFLGMLGELGYGFAYRVLDAQYFGVAQRRRRVFVVGCAGNWRSAAAVLFERHSLQRHPAPRREAREKTSLGTIRSTDGGSDVDHAVAGHLIPSIVSQAMSAKWAKGTAGPAGDEHHNLIPVPFDTTQITSAENFSRPRPGDACHPLTAGAQAPAICFNANDHGADALRDPAPTLRAGGHAGSHANAGVMPAIAFDGRARGAEPSVGRPERPPQTMVERTGAIDSTKPWNVACAMQVRRLTPRECERLQGFPDDYTAVLVRGRPAADGPRYKALGNSMAVPVMAWIGRRIATVTEIRRAA